MKIQPINTIILTHPGDSGHVLRDGLLSLGWNVIEDPMIDTASIPLSLADINLIDEADVLILTSKRGVSELIEQCGTDLLQGRFIICIGTKTAQELLNAGIRANWLPQGQTARQMCDELLRSKLVHGKKVTAVVGQLAEPTLHEALDEVCQFSRVDIYQTIEIKSSNPLTIQALEEPIAPMVCFTSASAVRSFAQNYKQLFTPSLPVASIGPVTTSALNQMGFHPLITTNPSTYEELLKQITALWPKRRGIVNLL